ncbi:hypothetical protein B0H17DRAFT_1140440 [Mycena rosella]|uniref:Uncharacterized protein n=1 Tax=Mycena rosella TaxID=1033263 RepID=A0AAD7GB92_MYCRO|nr:hypothetical protein B0H17DRAFT_1140440 [Mycena rosella]
MRQGSSQWYYSQDQNSAAGLHDGADERHPSAPTRQSGACEESPSRLAAARPPRNGEKATDNDKEAQGKGLHDTSGAFKPLSARRRTGAAPGGKKGQVQGLAQHGLVAAQGGTRPMVIDTHIRAHMWTPKAVNSPARLHPIRGLGRDTCKEEPENHIA